MVAAAKVSHRPEHSQHCCCFTVPSLLPAKMAQYRSRSCTKLFMFCVMLLDWAVPGYLLSGCVVPARSLSTAWMDLCRRALMVVLSLKLFAQISQHQWHNLSPLQRLPCLILVEENRACRYLASSDPACAFSSAFSRGIEGTATAPAVACCQSQLSQAVQELQSYAHICVSMEAERLASGAQPR